MIRLTTKELHSRLLDMAVVFHKICSENNIPYFMLGGTMLGAIRHKGIVPWDDDMDFGIPREYFDKFINIAMKTIPDNISLLTHSNSDLMIMGFAKMVDNETLVKEEFTTKHKRKIGINIDIFPLDHSDNKKNFFSKNYIVRSIIKIQKLIHVSADNRSLTKKIIAYIFQALFPINKNIIPNFLSKILTKRCFVSEKYCYYSNFYGAWGLKETVSKKIFGTPTLYSFEDMFLYGAQDADGYLKHLYGDYHIIPDESKRHIHSTEIYYIGESLEQDVTP